MPDFGTFAPKITLVRKFGHVTDIDDFVDAIADYKTQTTVTSLEPSAEDYSEEKNVMDDAGNVRLNILISGARKGENVDEDALTGFKTMFASFTNDWAEVTYDDGWTVAADSDSIKLKTSFKVKFANGDTATLTFTDKKITLSGYAIEATGTAFTTWANTQEIFSTDPDD